MYLLQLLAGAVVIHETHDSYASKGHCGVGDQSVPETLPTATGQDSPAPSKFRSAIPGRVSGLFRKEIGLGLRK
jgi:hypothetical protein